MTCPCLRGPGPLFWKRDAVFRRIITTGSQKLVTIADGREVEAEWQGIAWRVSPGARYAPALLQIAAAVADKARMEAHAAANAPTPRLSARIRLNSPIDGASVAIFRIAFGALMCWEVAR